MVSSFESREGCSVVDIDGPLRAPLDSSLRDRVAALLLRGERRIRLDVAGLTDIDAAGVGELVHMLNMTTSVGGVLQVVHASRRVGELLHAAGLSRVLATNGTPWPS